MASRGNADCNVGYYGVGIEDYLDEAGNMKAPLMLHIAEEDYLVPKLAQEKVKDELKNNQFVTIYTYPNVDHAFARADGKNYHEEYATLSQERSKSFLEKHLY
ncbi:hypothetical protein DSM106972_095360 [Dulcicalothrix desertica PCC 7102]|uniref:Dienelactone hydrolase domain-containing protein n=1 Tax=Dulcicalothrix desertica PCC 7102 TaxID=232991 RepID=A0A3S1A4Z7_9CYAN|nr:dienelactone hydrolase family protein [Dulcicalothrix desertica]RUS93777.1 hypothetical protein DSM106972_095360 [Dulcicalothrix desertica PCC 7102]